MKLLLCKSCHDVVKFGDDWRKCKCGKCAGRYLSDGVRAEFYGTGAVVLGLDNTSLARAIRRADPEQCVRLDIGCAVLIGHESRCELALQAFRISEKADTVRRVDPNSVWPTRARAELLRKALSYPAAGEAAKKERV
jgi:hypothetical protein